MKRNVFLSLALLATVLSSCLYESVEPIGTPGEIRPDSRLEGTWLALEPHEEGEEKWDYMKLIVWEHQGWLQVTAVFGSAEGGIHSGKDETVEMRAFPTMVEGELIYNVTEVNNEPPLWSFFQIDLLKGGDQLTLAGLDCEEENEGDCDPEPSAAVAYEYVAGALNSEDLWIERMVFDRVKD